MRGGGVEVIALRIAGDRKKKNKECKHTRFTDT